MYLPKNQSSWKSVQQENHVFTISEEVNVHTTPGVFQKEAIGQMSFLNS